MLHEPKSIKPLLFLTLLCLCSTAQERLTIDQAVAQAVEKNAALLADRANIAVAEARILTARLRINPIVSGSADHLDLLGTGFNDVNAGGPSEFSLRTDYTVERNSKRRARIEVAQATHGVVQLQFLDAVRSLALDVQSAFVDVLLAQENLALARANLQFLNQIVELNQNRVKAGDIAEVELVRSQLAALQFENTVRQTEYRRRGSILALQTLIGRRSSVPEIEVAGELRREAQTPFLDQILQQALAARPDIQALQQDVLRAEAEVRSQLALAKPDFTFGTEYRRQAVSAEANTLGFFFSVPLPVLNRNQGEIERARQEERQSRLRLTAQQNLVTGEVGGAFEQYRAAKALLENIENRMLSKARDVRNITEYTYRRGDASLLELLDAQRAFNETMQSFNEARAEHARALYLLDSVAGKVPGK